MTNQPGDDRYPPGQYGGWAPPPQGQWGYHRPDHPRATVVLVLGILSLVLCQLLGPVAWVMGRQALREIDASGGQLGGRGSAQAGWILGLISTVLLVLGVGAFLAFLVLGLAVGDMGSTAP